MKHALAKIVTSMLGLGLGLGLAAALFVPLILVGVVGLIRQAWLWAELHGSFAGNVTARDIDRYKRGRAPL